MKNITFGICALLLTCATLAALSLPPSYAQQAAPHDHDHGEHAGDTRDEHAGEAHDEHAQSGEPAGHDGHDHAEDGHDEQAHDEQARDEQGHDDHGHDDHGHAEQGHGEGVLKIAPEVLREFDIQVQTARRGEIAQTVQLPGEVAFNADRIGHVTPAVSGVVQKVNVSVGDPVTAGDVMAVIRSRELAAARSDYLAARARLDLARENLSAKRQLFNSRLALAEETLARDERLLEDRVGSERQVLASRQALREVRVVFDLETLEAQQAIDQAQIDVNQTANALHALGFEHEQIESLAAAEHAALNTYQLLAPISGIVTQRHLTVGEVVEPSSDEAPFVVADLSSVWVNLTVYQRDLAAVEAGQRVKIIFGHGIPDGEGAIAFVSPALDETTRTATARVVLDNAQRHWRPGLFVNSRVETAREGAAVVAPRSAVVELEGQNVVFVQTSEGFEPRPVQVGRSTEQHVEITAGLAPGDRYVTRNVLLLKAEMNRAALEHAGHAH